MIDRQRCIQIGLNIKAARKHAGLTVEQLADAVGVAHSMVHYWETGVREITAIKLEKVADALGASMLDLLGRCSSAADSGELTGGEAA